MTVLEAKKEYNRLLKRHYKAVDFFEREDVSQEEKEKFIPDHQAVLEGLNSLLPRIHTYDRKEMLQGFK